MTPSCEPPTALSTRGKSGQAISREYSLFATGCALRFTRCADRSDRSTGEDQAGAETPFRPRRDNGTDTHGKTNANATGQCGTHRWALLGPRRQDKTTGLAELPRRSRAHRLHPCSEQPRGPIVGPIPPSRLRRPADATGPCVECLPGALEWSAVRAVVQRVSRASVTINGRCVGEIETGLLVLLGVGASDTARDVKYLANKTAGLRIFEGADGRMRRSVRDIGGAVLAVPQFTLYGDVRRGLRPSFDAAAKPVRAEQLYDEYVRALRTKGVDVATGEFQAMMRVELVNDGPVTILIDSTKLL